MGKVLNFNEASTVTRNSVYPEFEDGWHRRSHIAPLVYLKGEDMDFFMQKISENNEKLKDISIIMRHGCNYLISFELRKVPRKAGDRWRI